MIREATERANSQGDIAMSSSSGVSNAGGVSTGGNGGPGGNGGAGGNGATKGGNGNGGPGGLAKPVSNTNNDKGSTHTQAAHGSDQNASCSRSGANPSP